MAKAPKPSLIDGKDIASILLDEPITHEFAPGRFVTIKAMGDEQLMLAGEAMERIVNVVQALVSQQEAGKLLVETLIAAVPTLIRVAMPELTLLIAASLRLSIEEASAIKLAWKVGIVQGIIEAEDVTLLIKNGKGLLSMFAGLPNLQAVAAMEAEAEEEAPSNLTGAPITNFSPQSTDSPSSASSE